MTPEGNVSLPGYTNLRPLPKSEGTQKDVFWGFHIASKSWKVLKQLKPDSDRTAIEDELRPLVARLRHPNIVLQDPPLFIDDDLWIIEELLDRTFEDLAPLRNRYGFATYARHIASALQHLHNPEEHSGRAIVHGDIHMKNCGLVGGVAKLFDFGRATYEPKNEQKSAPQGYICTRSPEQFAEFPQVSTAIDIWAFGCTLYALRMGEYPFIEPHELAEYKTAQRAKDSATLERIEGEVSERTTAGLKGVAESKRKMFDPTLLGILDDMLTVTEHRIPAADLEPRLKDYRAKSAEQTTNGDEAELLKGAVAVAQKALDAGEVDDFPWYREELKGYSG